MREGNGPGRTDIRGKTQRKGLFTNKNPKRRGGGGGGKKGDQNDSEKNGNKKGDGQHTPAKAAKDRANE